jgi:hypothetical protein
MLRTRAQQNLMLEQKHGEEHPKQEHDKKCLEQELDVSLPTTTTKKHKSKKHKLTKQKTHLVEAKATCLAI